MSNIKEGMRIRRYCPNRPEFHGLLAKVFCVTERAITVEYLENGEHIRVGDRVGCTIAAFKENFRKAAPKKKRRPVAKRKSAPRKKAMSPDDTHTTAKERVLSDDPLQHLRRKPVKLRPVEQFIKSLPKEDLIKNLPTIRKVTVYDRINTPHGAMKPVDFLNTNPDIDLDSWSDCKIHVGKMDDMVHADANHDHHWYMVFVLSRAIDRKMIGLLKCKHCEGLKAHPTHMQDDDCSIPISDGIPWNYCPARV